MFNPHWKRTLAMGLLATLLGLVGCDPQRINELEEGVSTEADVKARFGEPEKVWDAPASAAPGTRVFEYSRQPAGAANYMISIGPDGKMSALRQVLNAANFARVLPGMPMEDVRKLLGKPMKVTPFELKKEVHWDWRFQPGPNSADRLIFTVVFNPDMQVLSTATAPDAQAEGNAR
jgi:hypothetical protein